MDSFESAFPGIGLDWFVKGLHNKPQLQKVNVRRLYEQFIPHTHTTIIATYTDTLLLPL